MEASVRRHALLGIVLFLSNTLHSESATPAQTLCITSRTNSRIIHSSSPTVLTMGIMDTSSYTDNAYPRMILNSTFPGLENGNVYPWAPISMLQPPFDPTIRQPVAAYIEQMGAVLNWSMFPNSSPSEKRASRLAVSIPFHTRGAAISRRNG